MVSFNEVKKIFEKHDCELLMTEEVFNQKKSRTTKEKYKYKASCGHQYEIRLNNFKYKQQGLICHNCVNLKKSVEQKEKYKLNPILTTNLEFNSIEYLESIISDNFYVKFNGEDCLSDCCIKPKHITEDKWLMVQMKSTAKPLSNGGYKFHCKSTYTNCIIMCICGSDQKIWIFDGNKTTISCLSIGLTKSKKDEFEITKDTIHEKLTHYYNIFPKYDFETTDIPITQGCQLEREYRIYRETIITCLPFIRNYIQGLVYDFVVNRFKVQEKVSSQNKNSTKFDLDKNNGRNNGKNQHISYQQGDNDFYWLNLNNKQHFYIIPEYELINRNYINTNKRASITLNPLSKKCKNSWANEYLFDYTKIDEEKLKKIFSI